MEQTTYETFFEWLAGSAGFFLTALAVLVVLGGAIAVFVSCMRHGFTEGLYSVGRGLISFVEDVFFISPRRVFAMAKLAVQESIRRRVLLVAFALFAILLLVGGWFLDSETDHPGRLYISFVLWSSTLLILVLVVLLSCFSLPNDIKNRTIYTVVTKPVRVSEIVLGRIFGFAAIGTVLLVIMGVVSYFFIVRGLSHTHNLDATALRSSKSTETSFDSHHRHAVRVRPDGTTEMVERMGHTHEIIESDDGELALGPPIGELQARVPLYGKMQFINAQGKLDAKGKNVGNEWEYRSYVQGRSNEAVIWTFRDLTPEDFLVGLTQEQRSALLTAKADRDATQAQLANEAAELSYLPLEMTFEVFRTHKGDIEQPVTGSLQLRNPDTELESIRLTFKSAEFTTKQFDIPLKLKALDASGKSIDVNLFDDLVSSDGNLQVILRCEDRGQYFGAAQGDVYIRAADGSFAFNFAKGMYMVWLQMFILVCFGVMFSTLLNVVVSMLACVSAIVLGLNADMISKIEAGKIQGGGPLEAFIRVITQENVMTDFDMGPLTAPIQYADKAIMFVMGRITGILPRLDDLARSDNVAYGFNIRFDDVAINSCIALAFFLVLSAIAYFLLKTREVAA